MKTKRSGSGRAYTAHWDRIAPNWTDEVFNTLLCARNQLVAAELKAAARHASNIADFGCGIGTYLPMLSRLFDEVSGFEQSPKCVDIARKKHRARKNVSVDVAHRATPAMHNRFDAVLCVNVAIHPRKSEWHQVLRSMQAMLKPGGRFLLVVPSVESGALIARARMITAERKLASHAKSGVGSRIRPGVVRFGGVPTKHFGQKELRGHLADLGLKQIRFRRIEYSWPSHGFTPPKELRDARPWDWLVLARR